MPCPDDAISAGKRVLQVDPNYIYFDSALADAYREKGDLQEAVALYEKAQAVTHSPSAGQASTYVKMGRREDARRVLDQLAPFSRRLALCVLRDCHLLLGTGAGDLCPFRGRG